ncbi:protein-glutamine glutaminase family protein, partial [Streptomyces sp. NPDC057654]|uniref:protein-glutamine glutaminase family protein n=1 Tax=Streptomyces sp. NPDC057654 TaxID=3346196 RepID=UPI0036893CD8
MVGAGLPGQGLEPDDVVLRAVAGSQREQTLIEQGYATRLAGLLLTADEVDSGRLAALLDERAASVGRRATDAFDEAFHTHSGTSVPLALAGAAATGLLAEESVVRALERLYAPAPGEGVWDLDVSNLAPGVLAHFLPQVQAFALRLSHHVSGGRFEDALFQLRGLDRDLRKVWAVQDAYAAMGFGDLAASLRSLAQGDPRAVSDALGEIADTGPVPVAQVHEWYARLRRSSLHQHDFDRLPVPSGHPEDGCSLRAHLAAMKLQQWGAPVRKVIVSRTGPLLSAPSSGAADATGHTSGAAGWQWHYRVDVGVAAVLPDGTVTTMVLDTALDRGALSESDWLAAVGVPEGEALRIERPLEKVAEEFARDRLARPDHWTEINGAFFPKGRTVLVVTDPFAESFPGPDVTPRTSLRELDEAHRAYLDRLVEQTVEALGRPLLRDAWNGLVNGEHESDAARQAWAARTHELLDANGLLEHEPVLEAGLLSLLPEDHPAFRGPGAGAPTVDDIVRQAIGGLFPSQGAAQSRPVTVDDRPRRRVGAWLRNTGAAAREQQLSSRYGLRVGPGEDGGAHFGHSMLDKIDAVFGGLPRQDLAGNAHLTAIAIDNSQGPASAYHRVPKAVFISHPLRMPTWMYTRLDRGNAAQRWAMDTVAKSKYGGLRTADVLGVSTPRRHVMAGVSDVLAHGNLVEWTLRHEVGHSVDMRTQWFAQHSEKPEFGGWRTYYPGMLHHVTKAFLGAVGIEDQELTRRLATLIDPDEVRADPGVLKRLPDELADGAPDRLERLQRVAGNLRAAFAQPWTLDDGGRAPLEHEGRVYQVSPDGLWVSYLTEARDHALSNYQFSDAGEWFAEAYAGYHDPRTVNPPRDRLAPRVVEWFDTLYHEAEPVPVDADDASWEDLVLTAADGTTVRAADIDNLSIRGPRTSDSRFPASGGRSFHTPEDAGKRLRAHTDLDLAQPHYALYDQVNSPTSVPSETLREVPWDRSRPLYLAMLHGGNGWVTVPVSHSPVRLDGRSGGRMLSRRPSVQELRRTHGSSAQIILAACEAGATDELGDSVAQSFADETGLTVWAATTKVAATPELPGISFLVYHDADGEPGEWRQFTPSTAGAAPVTSAPPVTGPSGSGTRTADGSAQRQGDRVLTSEPVTQGREPFDHAALQEQLDAARQDPRYWEFSQITGFPPPPPKLTVGGRNGTLRPVPRELQFVWVGGRASDATLDNLRSWARQANESGWTVNLWLDAHAHAATAPLLTGDLADVTPRRIDERNLYANLPDDVRDKIRDLVDFAVSRSAFAVAGDVVRYAVLWSRGGVYLDVDIAPGRFTLPVAAPQLAVDGPNLPLLPPLIRDSTSFEQILRVMRDEGFPVGDTHEEQLESVARYRYARADYNNNLLVAPPRTDFLRLVLDRLPSSRLAPEELRDANSTAVFRFQHMTDASSSLTGPEFIANTARQYATGFGSAAAAGHGAPVDAELRDQWIKLAWITEESEVSAAGSGPLTSARRPPLRTSRQVELARRLRPRRGLLGTGRSDADVDFPEFLRAGDLLEAYDTLYPPRTAGDEDRDHDRLMTLRRLAQLTDREPGRVGRFTPSTLDGLAQRVLGGETVTDDVRRRLVELARRAKRRGRPVTEQDLARRAGSRQGSGPVGTPHPRSEATGEAGTPERTGAGAQERAQDLSEEQFQEREAEERLRAEERERLQHQEWERLRTQLAFVWRNATADEAVRAIHAQLLEAGPGSGSLVVFSTAGGAPAGRLHAANIDGQVLWAEPTRLDEQYGNPAALLPTGAEHVTSLDLDAEGALLSPPAELRALDGDAVRFPRLLPDLAAFRAAAALEDVRGLYPDVETSAGAESALEDIRRLYPEPEAATDTVLEDIRTLYPEVVPPVGFGDVEGQYPLGVFGTVLAFDGVRFDGADLPGAPQTRSFEDLVAGLLPEQSTGRPDWLEARVRAQVRATIAKLTPRDFARRLVDGGLPITVSEGRGSAAYTVVLSLTGVDRDGATLLEAPYRPYGQTSIGLQEAVSDRATGTGESTGNTRTLSVGDKLGQAAGPAVVSPKVTAGMSATRSYGQSRSTNAYNNPSLGLSGELEHFSFPGTTLTVTVSGPGLSTDGRSADGTLHAAFPTELAQLAANGTVAPWEATLPGTATDAALERLTRAARRFFSVPQQIGGLGPIRDQLIGDYRQARPGTDLHEYLHNRLGELSMLGDLSSVLAGGKPLPPVDMDGAEVLTMSLRARLRGARRIGDATAVPTVLNSRWLELQGASTSAGGGFSLGVGATFGPGAGLLPDWLSLQAPVSVGLGTSAAVSTAADTGGGHWQSVRHNGKSVPFLLTVQLEAGSRPLGHPIGREHTADISVVVRVPVELADAFQRTLTQIVAEETGAAARTGDLAPIVHEPQADEPPLTAPPAELSAPTGSSGLFGPAGLSGTTDVRSALREQFAHAQAAVRTPETAQEAEWSPAELASLDSFLAVHFHTVSLEKQFTELFSPEGITRTFLRPLSTGETEVFHFTVRAERVPAAPGEAIEPTSQVYFPQSGFDLWPSAMRDFANSESHGSSVSLGIGLGAGLGKVASPESDLTLFSRSHTAKSGMGGYTYALSGLNYTGAVRQFTYRVAHHPSVTARRVPASGAAGSLSRVLRPLRALGRTAHTERPAPMAHTSTGPAIEDEARWLAPVDPYRV